MKYIVQQCKQATLKGAMLMVLFALGILAHAQTGKDSKGKDFWLTFPQNFGGTAYLYISGEVNGSGTVSAPGVGFAQSFTTTVGQITTITLPASVFLTSSGTIQNNGIHVTCNQEITVYGMNLLAYTTDAYLGLPTDALGLEYIAMSYQGGGGSQIGMVATENATSVSFKLTNTTGAYIAGTTYTVNLNQGQTFFLQSTNGGDLTGSVITSNKPIAVFSGNQCTNVPSTAYACDHIVEQMPPTDGWGKNFVSVPLKTRNGDTYRFLASANNTVVSVNGVVLTTLNRGQFIERIYNTSLNITATQPILVAQYANGSTYDNANADPFMMLVTPYEQFLGSYTVNTPSSGFAYNFVNVVAPNSAVGTIRLDGVIIPTSSFSFIGSTGYSGAQIAVSIGVHTLTSNGLPFGVSAYGFNNYDSYGYPAGASYSPIASVTSIDITPKTGSNAVGASSCFIAKVLDQYGNPVAGVRVDFTITGPNSNKSGFTNTDANGDAIFCYVGSNPGNDNITASVGTLTSSANFSWACQTTPTIISTTSAIRCGTGSVVLSATPSIGTVNWYANATGGTPIGTGVNFTTPIISTTTTYYAEAALGACISTSRTAVTATLQCNQPPVAVCQPVTVFADADCSATATAAMFNGGSTDPDAGDVLTYSVSPAGPYSVGVTNVTLTVTDSKGASSSCNTTVTVVDNQFPVLVGVPADVTVECNAVPAAATVTATDNCSTSVPTYTETRTNGDCPSRYTLTRTWSTTDASNNTTTASQTITVQDTQAPVLSEAPANVTVECNAVPTAAVLTATDNCDAPTVTYAEVRTNGNCPSNYTLTRTWTATDACGNTSSKTQTITVQDTQAPVLSAAPANITVECNAVPTAAVLTATDNCDNAPTVAYVQTSTQNADINNAGHYNYTLTRIWTATDACGNTSSKTQVITVQDKTAPVITCPAIAPVCNDLAGNIKTLTLTGVDNCNSPILVSYTVSGATVKAATTSATATESFNVGTSYVNWTVKDVSGNTITCTTTVVIWALPVASYVTSNADAFCNKLTLTANSTLSGPYTYAWSYNNAPFATIQQIQLDNTNGDGNYSVYTYDVNGCRSAVPAVYNYQKQNIISNYTILANKEVELHGYNSVQSGSVGLMKAEGKAEFEKYASMTGAGAFVKAPKIEVDNGASVPTKIIGIATVSLPTMQVNTITNQQYNALPSYTVNQSQTISLSGNYKDLKIKKGANVTLSGTVFGKIDIEEGSVVRFTSTTINIGDMKVGKGPNNGSTIVKFANNTSVRVSKQVKIEEDCNINPDGYQVTFYLGDEKCDEEKFQVKGGNTTVTANVYAPNGKIKVTGGSNCHNHGNGGYVNMIGLFIADEVESEGKYVNWNNYTCTNSGNAAPVANYASIDAAEEVVSKLEVRVAPNPTSSEFVLIVHSKSTDLVNIKVTDAYGKVVAMINKVVPGSAIRVGNNFTSGVYFAEVIQGSQRKVVKMAKGN